MTITFCGHGKLNYNENDKNKLYNVVEKLILCGADEFLLGGYGNFDIISAEVVKSLKIKYKNINSVLVIPYIGRDFNHSLYDCSEYPPIENVPKRLAIIKRNEWMIDKSDVLVAYVINHFGGAVKTLEYAKRKNKKIINLAVKDE